MLTATKVMEMCKNAGVIVTDNDLVWKQVSGLTDRNNSSAGDSKLFYVLQKKLIVEMIMDVLSLDAQTVTDLEYAGEGVSPLQFNVPQGATGGNVRYHYKPDFAAHFNKQKMYHDEQRREGKAIGKEGNHDMRSKWYHLEDIADVLCTQCRAEGAQSTANCLYNAKTCINCHADGLIQQNTMYKGAERPIIMKRFFAECSLVLCDMNELESKFDGGMDAFVSHLIVKLFDKKFAKEMSQIGGITLDQDAFADYFRSSNGKQLWVDKLSYIVTHSDGAKERTTTFRVWRDYGTLYTLRGCVGSSVKTRHTEFSPPTTRRSWEMGWRPSSDSLTSYPTSERSCQSGGTFANTDQFWNGTVKYTKVPNKTVRDTMDGLACTNPFIDLEEASSPGQKRKLLNNSLVEIRDLLSRFIAYREDDPSNISNCVRCHHPERILLLRGMRL